MSRTVHRSRLLRIPVALIPFAATSLLLTGCATGVPAHGDYDAWSARMQTVFDDPDGNGGGGAEGPGSVELPSTRTGRWVAYAVCADAGLVHVRIRGGDRTLAETDVPCGATVAMPLTVDSAAARRFEVSATAAKGATGAAWWSVHVNSAAWRQTGSFAFD